MTTHSNAVIIWVLSLAAVFLLNWLFIFRQLRTRHPETFVRLGSPTLIMNNSIANGLRVTAFILAFRFVKLRDASLSAACVLQMLLFATIFVLSLSVPHR